MSSYILINRIEVQNANAIAGFTWGFPAITHFLGFSHNLARKLNNKSEFDGVKLSGCAVISHTCKPHIYGEYDKQFTQSRNPPYLASHDKRATPPIIEEGKMNMTVSLLIKCSDNASNCEDSFIDWLKNICYLQRLAGGTILNIKDIQLFSNNRDNINSIKRQLLPGFVLFDRSEYLENHCQALQGKNDNAELFDAWLDFITLKQQARPKFNLIQKHFKEIIKKDNDNQYAKNWETHLNKPYNQENITTSLKKYFNDTQDKKLLQQWQEYCNPTEKTDANWEYLPKPKSGFLVPIMTGYKAISKVYKSDEVKSTRDSKTDVCFMESIHSVGEWMSAHRLNDDNLDNSIWNYHYEENWYICKQANELNTKNINDDDY